METIKNIRVLPIVVINLISSIIIAVGIHPTPQISQADARILTALGIFVLSIGLITFISVVAYNLVSVIQKEAYKKVADELKMSKHRD